MNQADEEAILQEELLVTEELGYNHQLLDLQHTMLAEAEELVMVVVHLAA
jgi:hypothetical protein